MAFDLPHPLLMQRSYDQGLSDGRQKERQDIVDYIRQIDPTLRWLAEAIEHGEHK